jgi:hypothetical protein
VTRELTLDDAFPTLFSLSLQREAVVSDMTVITGTVVFGVLLGERDFLVGRNNL